MQTSATAAGDHNQGRDGSPSRSLTSLEKDALDTNDQTVWDRLGEPSLPGDEAPAAQESTSFLLRWCLLFLAFVGTASTGWAQGAPDAAWTGRFNALQEEHDAQAGVAVSIVFDDSGSMNDHHKLEMAKQAFRTWIEHAPTNYRFGLVALNAGELVPLGRNNRAQILAAVNGLRASGATPLARTVASAGAAIRQRRLAGTSYERQIVVILTDGEDTTKRGVTGVQEEIRKLRASNVEVIAFGYQNEGDYMKDDATHFYSPENGQDISKGLDAIGSEIGDTSDVAVDDATRAAMRTISVPAQVKIAPDATPAMAKATRPFSPDDTAANASPTPPAARAKRKTIGRGYFIAGLVIAFALIVSRRKSR